MKLGLALVINHMLSLIPEEELDEADYEPSFGWTVFTTSQSVINYAYDHGFLCLFCTGMDVAYEAMTKGDVCRDCCSKIMDYLIEEIDDIPVIKRVDEKLVAYYNKQSNLETQVTKSNA